MRSTSGSSSYRALALSCVLFLLSFSTTIKGQWSLNHTFPHQIRSVFFLNNQTRPSTGFVGLFDGEIWRTTNNGATWAQSTTPGILGIVTGFGFKDSMVGWCSFRPVALGGNSCWMTTDGGKNWHVLSPTGTGVDVSYNPAANLLFLSCWTTGTSLSSNDLGNTWNSFAPANQSGVAWSDASHGIVSVLSGNFYNTSDGGNSWTPVPAMNPECWSPCGIPNTLHFFSIGEKTRQVYASVDGGNSWQIVYNFPPSITPIGDIEGNASLLLIQSQASGFYSSTDQGHTWNNICGPSNDRDTRFYVKGSEVFAGTPTGDLWYIPDATQGGSGPHPLALKQTAKNYLDIGCLPLDSILRFSYAGGCPLVLRKLQLSGSPAFQIGGYPSLPRYVSGADSVDVVYAPIKGGFDTAQILVEYTIGTVTFDTIIQLTGRSLRTLQIQQSLHNISQLLRSVCDARDTSIIVRNLSCDSAFLTAADLSDSSVFSLKDQKLPKGIAPGDSIRILIHTSSPQPGDFTATLHLSFRNSAQRIDTNIYLGANIPAFAKPILTQLHAQIPNRCALLDTSILIQNVFCDTISITSLGLSDSSVFRVIGVKLPMTIAPSDTFRLRVVGATTRKGLTSTLLSLRFQQRTLTLDTALTLTLSTTADVPAIAQLGSDKVSFGLTSVCLSKEQSLVISNPNCRDMIVTAITLSSSDSAFSDRSFTLPDTLRPGRLDSILLRFHPRTAGPNSAFMVLHLSVDAVGRDTSILLTGAGYETVVTALDPPILSFDSITTCDVASVTAYLQNNSCDSLYISEATVSAASGFTLDQFKLPRWLHSGDSLPLRVLLTPRQLGLILDSIDIRLRPGSKSAPEVERTLLLRGFAIAPKVAMSYVPSSIKLDSLTACARFDTTVTIRNLSKCNDASLKTIAIEGDTTISFLDSAMLPAVLAPGDSLVLHFEIESNNRASSSSLIHVRGTGFDTTIPCVFSFRTNARALVLSFDDTLLKARPCKQATKTLTLSSIGCESVLIDSVSLIRGSSASMIVFDSLPNFPLRIGSGSSISFRILYDAGFMGDSTTLLRIASNEANYEKVVRFRGMVVGSTPIARFGLDAVPNNSGSPTAGDTIITSLINEDDIDGPIGVKTLSCTIGYDPDVLRLVTIDTPRGWRIADSSSSQPGSFTFHLQATHPTSIPRKFSLARISFATTLSANDSSSVTLNTLQLNAEDSSFERCSLTPLSITPIFVARMANSCGDSLIRSMLRREPIQVVGIHPNPILLGRSSKAQFFVDLELATAMQLDLTIIDSKGVTKKRLPPLNFAKGPASVRVNVDDLPSGDYFVRIGNGSTEVARKFAVGK